MKPRAVPSDAFHTPGLSRAVEVGPRIFLRYLSARDRGKFIALKLASRKFLEPWEATPPSGLDTFSPAFFARLLKNRRNDSNHRFVICRRGGETPGEILGQIGLSNIIRGSFQSCYVGYWIGSAHARQGFTAESLHLALRFAFRTLKLHRVEANIVPRNKASKGLAKKLGLRYEGTAKRYLRIAGKWADHEHWAMTVEDWRVNTAARSPPST